MWTDNPQTQISRRGCFERMSTGLYGAALTYLMGEGLASKSTLLAADGAGESPSGLQPRSPHFAPKARAVIHLFMNGGPSQMDLFDPKPMLDKHHGTAYFDKIAGEIESP